MKRILPWVMLMAGGLLQAGESSPGSMERIRRDGYSSDPADVRSLLQAFADPASLRAEVDPWLARIQNGSFRDRRQARLALEALPVLPLERLRDVSQVPDPELQLTLGQLMADAEPRMERLLIDLLDTVRERADPAWVEDLVRVRAACGASGSRLAWRAAFRSTLDAAKPEALRRLAQRGEAAVRLEAALALGRRADPAALAPLVDVLASGNPEQQHLARDALVRMTGRDGVSGESEIAAWTAWLAQAGDAPILAPLPPMVSLALFNGVDLSSWQAVLQGRPEAAEPSWRVEDGLLRCLGQGHGYLRTLDRFTDYRLSLEWRWPQGAGDSGVFLFLSGEDAQRPRCLEVQLLSGRAGDFWILGGFQAAYPEGRLGGGRIDRLGDASEHAVGQWNALEIQVLNGSLEVRVNGVLQNTATEIPRQPGSIGLQMEGDAIDFRKITLEPLSP